MRGHIGLGLLLALVAGCGRCGPSGSGSTGGLTAVDGEAAAAPLDFGNVPVGQSVGLALTIKNIGDTSLDISRLALSGTNAGDFVIGTTAATSLAASQTTSVGVRFTPKAPGMRAATVTIFTDSGVAPNVTVALTGNGTQISLSVAPEPVDFGTVQVGAPAATIALMLGNTGNLPLQLTAGALTGSQASWFSVGSGFGALLPGAMQSVTLSFAPAATGAATADLPIQVCSGSGAANCSNLSVTLQGMGVDSQLVYNPSPVTFAMVPAGNSVMQTVTLTNTGTADVSVTQMATQSGSSAVFDLQSLPSFPADLPAGQALTFAVQYTPTTTAGGDNDSIVATYLASGEVSRTATDVLTGAGVATPCSLTLSPTSLTFAAVGVGTAVTQQVSLSNSGTTACQISAIQLDPSSDPGYSLAAGTSASLTVPANGSAPIGVQYLLPSESTPFTRLGTLTFESTDPNLPAGSVPLTANLDLSDFPCMLTIAPSSLNYGTVAESTPTALQVTITNPSMVDCQISSVALSGTTDPDYTLAPADQTSFTIAAGTDAMLGVVFDAPTDNAPLTRLGDLLFDTSDSTQPMVDIPLTAIIGVPSPYSAGWPKWHNDNTDQGRTGNDTSKLTGTLKWKFALSSAESNHYIQSPVVDGNGNIYQMGMDGTFYAVNPAGHQLWAIPLMVESGGISADPHPATPIIARDGTLFVSGGEGGTLYHVAPDGGVLGSVAGQAEGDGFDVCPSITNDGGLLLDGDDFGPVAAYAQSNLSVLYSNTNNFGGGAAERVALAVGADDSSYWCADNSCVSFTSPAKGFLSNPAWPAAGIVPAPDVPSDTGTPELALDLKTGNLVVVVGYSEDGATAFIEVSSIKASNGAFNWHVKLPAGTMPDEETWGCDVGNATPAIDSNGIYYIGSLDGLYALNPANGAINWHFKAGDVVTAPAIGGDGDIFFGDAAGTFYAVHPDGSVRFTVPLTTVQLSGSPAIGPDGTIFVVGDDAFLYAIE